MTVSQRAKLCSTNANIVSPTAHESLVSWFALQTRSRHEKIVRTELQSQAFETFLPTIKRMSQWKDRKKEIEFPLFSGYCFARFSLFEKKLSIVQSPGVVRIVGSHSYPEPIPDHEIESLRILMKNKFPHDYHPYLKEGMRVEIVRGPLEGVTGRLARHARHCRIVINITLIQQAVAVEVDASDVVPVESTLVETKHPCVSKLCAG